MQQRAEARLGFARWRQPGIGLEPASVQQFTDAPGNTHRVFRHAIWLQAHRMPVKAALPRETVRNVIEVNGRGRWALVVPMASAEGLYPVIHYAASRLCLS